MLSENEEDKDNVKNPQETENENEASENRDSPIKDKENKSGDRKTAEKRNKKIILVAVAIAAVLLSVIAAIFISSHISVEEKYKTLLEGKSDFAAWRSDYEETVSNYSLSDEEKESYESLLKRADSVSESEHKELISVIEDMNELKDKARERNKNEIALKLEEAENTPVSCEYAYEEEKTKMADLLETAKDLYSKDKFTEAGEKIDERNSIIASVSEKKTGYSINLIQTDVSEYPTIKLYFDIKDSEGNTVNGLSGNMFFVSEKDAATGGYLMRTVEKASQMNEREALNLNLVIDTSSSMAGAKMNSAKNVINSFLNDVQFEIGDKVKLTPFNSYIDKSQAFETDRTYLQNCVSGLVPTGLTKLYDTIVYSVQDSFAENGAKCVIAFTDGHDEGSYYTADEAADIVSRYKIPVIIVRVGDSSYSMYDAELKKIAEASGGLFKNIDDFNMDFESFYEQIYRKMKDYYVIEYQTGNTNLSENISYDIYVRNYDEGGEFSGAINASSEIFDNLLSKFLRGYINAMNNRDYSLMAEYVDPDGGQNKDLSMSVQMQKQVSGGFSNVYQESLLGYTLEGIERKVDNTYIVTSVQNYDVIYREDYNTIMSSDREVMKKAVPYIQSSAYEAAENPLYDVWASVNQRCVYEAKRGEDGKWRFSKYVKPIDVLDKEVYDVERVY